MLTEDDVKKLMQDPSVDNRAEAATKIASQFEKGKLSDGERKIAEEIFRIMVEDAEVRVRESISKQLKECPDVPHDVAVSLARDVDDVSLPMLQYSQVLRDSDLVEIIQSQDVSKQVAVASRSSVSTAVSDALVATHNENVVTSLVANKGAEISDESFESVMKDFGNNKKIQEELIDRDKLPIGVAERLVHTVSEAMKKKLMAHHNLSASITNDVVLQSRERATLGLMTPWSSERDVEKLVKSLKDNGRLTPTIILRSLCMGDVGFFEAAMSILTKVPLVNVRVLVHDQGSMGFKALYSKAGMPGTLFPAFRSAIEVFSEMEFDGQPGDKERFTCRLLERLLTQFEDMGIVETDDMEYLMTRFNKIVDAQDAAPAGMANGE